MADVLIDTENNGWVHLVAESLAELQGFAVRADIAPCWYRWNEGWPHYDLRGDNIQKALDAGAVQVERSRLFRFMVRHYGIRKCDQRRAKRKRLNISKTQTNLNFIY